VQVDWQLPSTQAWHWPRSQSVRQAPVVGSQLSHGPHDLGTHLPVTASQVWQGAQAGPQMPSRQGAHGAQADWQRPVDGTQSRHGPQSLGTHVPVASSQV
jgi:hypothetical protein